MAKSITVKPKKRGRPATGRDPIIGVRLAALTIKALDRVVVREGSSRSSVIRRLIELGLKDAAKGE